MLNATTPDPQAFFSVPAPAVCRDGRGNQTGEPILPDGGYLALNGTVRIDAAAQVTGICNYCIYGQYYFSQDRYLMGVDLWTYTPTLASNHSFVDAQYHSQSLDTRSGGIPYPITTSLTEIGGYSFTFQTKAYATSCSPIESSGIISKNVSVVKCEPFFAEEAGNTIRLEPLTFPSKIQIYLPENMSEAGTALEAAKNAWNSVLPPGVQFDVVTTACGTGPSCIAVMTATSEQASCGYAYREWTSSGGVITGNLQLRLHPDWRTFSAEGLHRTFIHELGHYLGLDNFNSNACGISDAAMQDQFDCTAQAVMHSVTANDSSPVVNSAYAGKPKVACGF